MIDKTKLNSVERDLVEGLEEFVHDLKNGAPIEKKYTCRGVVLDIELKTRKAKDVKSTRKLLNASQAIFAQFLGVSVKAVRKWEGGQAPSEMASRFMDEIRRNPEYWRKRLRESLRTVRAKRFDNALATGNQQYGEALKRLAE
jgi:DNA-binding transcriptional regulator YiaG